MRKQWDVWKICQLSTLNYKQWKKVFFLYGKSWSERVASEAAHTFYQQKYTEVHALYYMRWGTVGGGGGTLQREFHGREFATMKADPYREPPLKNISLQGRYLRKIELEKFGAKNARKKEENTITSDASKAAKIEKSGKLPNPHPVIGGERTDLHVN